MNQVRENLMVAEEKATNLFNAIENNRLIIPGKSEKQLNSEIFKLAKELFNIDKYWHKRIVRAGKNTLKPYDENPEDLIIQDDDIIFFDFGPVFEEWEADFGRTYVLGNDPLKHKLMNDISSAWFDGKSFFQKQTEITGAELYTHALELASKYGWEFGGEIAGHIIGHFPHEKLEKEDKRNYIHPDNHENMLSIDEDGTKREWILEIHFVNREKEIGGFFEQLLT